jgi:hypothetical protein
MSDQPSPPERDRWERGRDDRWERRHERPESFWNNSGPVIAGIALIAIGLIFLLRNFGYPIPINWWAVFIFLPALGAFSAAWSTYQRNGRKVTQPVIGSALVGLLLAGLAVALLLGLDLSLLWPVLLILLGVAALGRGLWRR